MTSLAELAGEAIAAMAERGKGGRQFRATFFRSDGLARAISVETGAPPRDAELGMRLFAERIDALRDPIYPGFGFDMIPLSVPRPEAPRPSPVGLGGGAGRGGGPGAGPRAGARGGGAE